MLELPPAVVSEDDGFILALPLAAAAHRQPANHVKQTEGCAAAAEHRRTGSTSGQSLPRRRKDSSRRHALLRRPPLAPRSQ